MNTDKPGTTPEKRTGKIPLDTFVMPEFIGKDGNNVGYILLRNDGYIHFVVQITDPDVKHRMAFDVYEVTTWECDKHNTPSEMELYISGAIKWEGCSHVFFGEKDQEGKYDGYIHLCGKRYWKRHCEMMMALYSLSEKVIINYDLELSS